MLRKDFFIALLFSAPVAMAAEPPQEGVEAPAEERNLGMSIVGNHEAPKSLVIVPWKSSELGNRSALAGLLDDVARPVDKEVFMRELEYYRIKAE
ncbi:hypothetical protein [Thioalkalivibrio sp. XN279]|uniref:hypothetical protein n=1 Tax=Thioalkalivibrio sp. XN279 TaxID=2714953 RepID=UPI00140DFECD|nr:hypothetical protein [Thioalkalivibrio sp. XN279]NHA14238.1 hypothetical protein [Thioalkalivibrio sp. XN279]